MKADHERIWLQNAEDAKHCREGRMWCQDKAWPIDKEDGEPTEYVRADLLATARAEARAQALEEAAEACEEDAEGEAALLTAARKAGVAQAALAHSYAADTLRARARAIRALIAPPKREEAPE